MKTENENRLYELPNMGCMLGTAYQTLVSRLAETLQKEQCGISVAEYMVLRAIYTCDGMQQCEIGEMVGKDKGAVCRTVKSLEAKGLVRTEQISHKCLRVYITDKGTDIRPSVMRIAEAKDRQLSKLLCPEELEAFQSILMKIIGENR